MIKRVIEALAVIFTIILITFFVLNVIPGDPVQLMLGERADAASVEMVRHEMGLDKPLSIQFINYVNNLLHLNLGVSYFTHEPVLEPLSRAFLVTLKLAGLSYSFALIVGILSGVIAAVNKGKAVDRVLMTTSIIGISAPSFWVAIILQIIFGLKLNLLPISGGDTLASFILPAFALGIRYVASIARITRTSMLEVIHQDFVRTADAKGISKYNVIVNHIFRNALIPIITLVGTELGSILTGSMLIEKVFSISGIGKMTVDSILSRDLPLLQGATIYIAAVCVIIYLLVDISYAYVDPRIRFGEEK
jgi:peptide/nickel transport system permease protein